MKALLLAAALFSSPHPVKAKTMTDANLSHRIQMLEDRAAIKNVVDTFSNLADIKDIDSQLQLFTEDATVTSHVDGQPSAALQGREQIGQAFKGFLGQFDTVYHMNGQQTVDIAGDTAKGVAYSLVILIGQQDGKRIRSTMGVTYHDDFVRRNGKWLIADRVSHFVWRSSEPVGE